MNGLVMPIKWVSNAAARPARKPRHPMTGIWYFVQQTHNFIVAKVTLRLIIAENP
jgi:hypothetical protein